METLGNTGDRTSADEVRICIGVCTRQRPQALTRLLESLTSMQIPTGVDLTLCVVENDTLPRSQELVTDSTAQAGFTTVYELEPDIGIPQARNRLLDMGIKLDARAIIFVDDDETVRKDWLQQMCDFARQTDWKSVLQGHVETRLPESTHRTLAPFFKRRARETGEQLTLCATNNTLLPLAPIREYGLRFDESRALEGGEDTIFFAEARQLGVQLTFCKEAVVEEPIPDERATLWWLCKRKFRAGLLMGSGRVPGKPRSGGKAIYYFIKSLLSFLLGLLYILLIQPSRAIRSWLSGFRSLGYSMGYLRIKTYAYRKIEGR